MGDDGAMRRYVIFIVWALALGISAPTAARQALPPTVELDGCVLPSTLCQQNADVIDLVVRDTTLKFAVERMRFASSTNLSTGKILTEMRLRPVRVQGPLKIVEKLEVGMKCRMRGLLRLGPSYYIMVNAVEPLGEKP